MCQSDRFESIDISNEDEDELLNGNIVVVEELVFNSGTSEFQHVQNVNDYLSPPCLLCNEQFVNDKLLMDHMKSHKILQFICSICQKDFLSKLALSKHYHSAHSNVVSTTSSPASSIKHEFKSNSGMELNKHDKFIHGYTNACNNISVAKQKRFLDTNGSLLHLQSCSVCDMQLHAKSKHTIVCEICGLLFNNFNELSQHIRTHSLSQRNGHNCNDNSNSMENDYIDIEIDDTASLKSDDTVKCDCKYYCHPCNECFHSKRSYNKHVHQNICNKPIDIHINRDIQHRRRNTSTDKMDSDDSMMLPDTIFPVKSPNLNNIDQKLSCNLNNSEQKSTCILKNNDQKSTCKRSDDSQLNIHIFQTSGQVLSNDKSNTKDSTSNLVKKRGRPAKVYSFHTCDICGLECQSSPGLKRHTQYNNNLQQFKCNRCLKLCYNKTCLRIHKRNKHKRFAAIEEKQLNEHQNSLKSFPAAFTNEIVEKNTKEETCNLCSKSFFASYMPTHMKNHHCKCAFCSMDFLNSEELFEHINSNHQHCCNSCSKIFFSLPDLEHHINTTHQQKQLQNISNLKIRTQHEVVTDKNDQNQITTCPECNTSYNSTHELMIHFSQEHDYKLSPSAMTTMRSQNNKKIQLADKVYRCLLCSYLFATKIELDYHMLQHNGTEAHKLIIVPVTSTTLPSLIMQTVPAFNTICSICKRTTTSQSDENPICSNCQSYLK